MSYAGKRVLVTGGLGFVGSNLVRRLVAQGARVTVLDNLDPQYGGNRYNLDSLHGDVQVVEGDQCDEQVVRPLVGDSEYVFNLVGQVSHSDSMADPYKDLRTNVTAHVALLESMRKERSSAKVLYTGTRGQYGRAERAPVHESTAVRPVDVNGVNKHAGEMYHFLYAHAYGLKVTSLRLTNTYGPRHTMRTHKQGVFAWFVRRAMDGEEIQLWGGGEQLRDFCYVEDTVDALLLAMESPAADGEVFNLGGEAASLARVAELIVREAGGGTIRKIPYPPEHQAIEVGDYSADISKVKHLLGWVPRTSLADGIRATVEFCRQHGRHYWDWKGTASP